MGPQRSEDTTAQPTRSPAESALEAVCHYFWTALATAARRVHGSVSEHYDRMTALAIAKDFSDRWDGCPNDVI